MTPPARRRVLITADTIGGVWQYACDLASALPAHGIEVVLAVLGPAPSGEQRARLEAAPGVRLVETGEPLDWLSDAAATMRTAATIADMAADEGVDVVHLNSPALAGGAGFAMPTLGVAHGCPATWWQAARPGRPLDPGFTWHRELMRRGLRACDRIIAPTAGFAQAVRHSYRLPSTPAVVANGRSAPGPAASEPLHDCALTVGRLWDDVKNVATLDRVAARLAFPFYAAGPLDGPQGERISLDHLHPLGCLAEGQVATRLAQRPVFVSAATFEPFGLAVLEAAQHGCALVLSDIATFRELWDGAAVFVDPHDEAALALAIEDAVQDLPQRRALGEAARSRAERYSVERMATAMAGHYDELLARRAAA